MSDRGRSQVRPKLSSFARRLLAEWRRLDAPTDVRVVVAVSGGADSTALLLALTELVKAKRLALQLTVAHLDHELRGAAGQADARWVEHLTRTLGHEIKLGRAPVREHALEASDNLEQAARRARYEFLAATAHACEARVVLTAHTADDQAETVLLRLLRGSGADGLGGIAPVRALAAGSAVLLIRPLLSWSARAQAEQYCRERKVEFRSDEMNKDERFARVRVRHQLLPLLGTFNRQIVATLVRTAALLREDSSALDKSAAELLAAAGETATDGDPPLLKIAVLSAAPAALRRRALRQWIALGRGHLRRLEMVHLQAIETLLTGARGGRIIELPGGATVRRQRGHLRLSVESERNSKIIS